MLLCRSLPSIAKSTRRTFAGVALSDLVKQLSKFATHGELLEYSHRPIDHCYPIEMIDSCAPERFPPLDLVQTAASLHDQLRVRIAHGIHYFQALPFLPAANPILLSLHQRYLKLFEKLTAFPPITSLDDEEKFFQFIYEVMQETDGTIGKLSAACQDAQKYFKSYNVMRDFLDNVLRNRLCVRLLAEHYLGVHIQQKKGKTDDQWRGAIYMNFSPLETVQQCIADVSAICLEHYSVVPHVQIENHINQSFPYFPNVMEYILRELLKNAMRAVVEYSEKVLGNVESVKQYFEENRDLPLCKVLITSDPADEHFTIAIKDHGGGVNTNEERLFRYMFSGTDQRGIVSSWSLLWLKVMWTNRSRQVSRKKRRRPSFSPMHSNVYYNRKARLADVSLLDWVSVGISFRSKHMYGHGFGLPICRLYAQLFAGSLTLRQVPHIGTDVYLRLGFLNNNSERIRIW